ncbi:MAG: hypothetical protein ACJ73D_05765 [Pyrinomonadaceae bacterium]
MRSESKRHIKILIWVILIPCALSSCSANEQILKSGKESPTPTNVESTKSDLDEQIQSLRTADFRYIWAIRRKDGGVLDKADKAVIRQNTVEMNRRVLADDDKAVLIGSNTVPFKENFDILASAYAIQDLSPQPVPSPLPTREPTPKSAKAKR